MKQSPDQLHAILMDDLTNTEIKKMEATPIATIIIAILRATITPFWMSTCREKPNNTLRLS